MCISIFHSQLHELLADKDMLFIGLDRTERSTLCYEDFIATGSSEYEITFTDENAPLMHLHTSGSSGKPKTVVYSHRAFLNQLENCIDGLGFYEDMVFLSMSQMFHSACVGLYACIAIGARSVVFSRFDPQQYLKAINDEHITRVSAIPTVLQGLLNQPNLDEFNFSSVHTIGYSAAPMSPALIDKAISYFHCGFMQSYGMTEMASILSRGAAKLYCVQNDELQGAAADSFFVASTLAESIKKIGDVDLVLFGEGSGDMYSQQTGLVVGALLGVPVVNGVSKIELVDGKLKLRRSLDDGVEQLEVSLPAVVCVSADINVPRFTSVRDTLSAGKKPFEIWPLQEVCAPRHGSVTVSVLAPEQTGRNQQVYQSPDEAAIKAVAAELKKYI